ncbi:DUF2177 family protein [Phenylobacterium soli]|uniref:DUF2177 domain-containing protein n=1 Tax=Phenylobacterium soli TaxID=2170551 RepID=A0A328AK77_9CAUL|nr:DUF2177 family protein [Phenylobacterium soli]RAK54456.1 DUF2177 domain-containing protein [Phenylobacterium soli]
MPLAIAYGLTLVIFAVIDTLWLGAMGERLYRPLIGGVLAERFRAAPAIVFYVVYAAGLALFAVRPGLGEGWRTALVWGGLFGFFAYATYDLTNYATLRTWSLTLTIVDMAWGVVVSAASASLATLAASKVIRLVG